MAAATVEEYTQGLSEEGRNAVQEFAGFLAQEYPQLHGKISFSMPMWLCGKKMNEGYVAISAAKRLTACKTGKRCVNIRYGDQASFDMVKASLADFFQRIDG